MYNFSKNVIRGLHYQEEPHQIKKFITCIKGEVLDIFVDIRKDSKRMKNMVYKS